jgi:hypothetical protein
MQAQPLTFSWGGAPVADTMIKAEYDTSFLEALS